MMFPRKNSRESAVSIHLLLSNKYETLLVIALQQLASTLLMQSLSFYVRSSFFSNSISGPGPDIVDDGEAGNFDSSSESGLRCSSCVIRSMKFSTFYSRPKIESLNLRYALWSIGIGKVISICFCL